MDFRLEPAVFDNVASYGLQATPHQISEEETLIHTHLSVFAFP